MDKRLLDPRFNPRAGEATNDNAACEETLFDRYAAAALAGGSSVGLVIKQAIYILEERARLFGVTVEEKT